MPQNTYTYHKRLNSDTEIQIKERFTYDSQNRLLKHYHQINTNAEELLSDNTYNELSQLKTKNVGGSTAAPLQTVDYAYNIRGWMTQINDPTALGTDLFGYKMNYTSSSEPATAPGRYNGNIAEVVWKSAYTNKQKNYLYQYDTLNRLTAGLYRAPLTATPETDFYTEKTNYDLNGNINNLKRYSASYGNNSTPLMIDNLGYTYIGNQLQKIMDISNNYNGYPAGGNTITYDANGNMTSMPDKYINQINYNFLNLPNLLTQDGKNTNYLYRTDGIKVKKVREYDTFYFDYLYWDYFSYPTSDITEYLDGFQYLLRDYTSKIYSYYNPYNFVPYSPSSHIAWKSS